MLSVCFRVTNTWKSVKRKWMITTINQVRSLPCCYSLLYSVVYFSLLYCWLHVWLWLVRFCVSPVNGGSVRLCEWITILSLRFEWLLRVSLWWRCIEGWWWGSVRSGHTCSWRWSLGKSLILGLLVAANGC